MKTQMDWTYFAEADPRDVLKPADEIFFFDNRRNVYNTFLAYSHARRKGPFCEWQAYFEQNSQGRLLVGWMKIPPLPKGEDKSPWRSTETDPPVEGVRVCFHYPEGGFLRASIFENTKRMRLGHGRVPWWMPLPAVPDTFPVGESRFLAPDAKGLMGRAQILLATMAERERCAPITAEELGRRIKAGLDLKQLRGCGPLTRKVLEQWCGIMRFEEATVCPHCGARRKGIAYRTTV